jgi:spermidine synthase
LIPVQRGGRASTTAVLATVFLCGGVLLGVEMAASRVLAPFFGNSLFVWAAIIGVILGGLAAGYWLGGALGDRYPTPLTLAAVIAAGAVSVLAIPFADRPVIEAVLAWDPGARLDPVLCTAILFLPMAVLLSAVGPIATRLQADALSRVGRTAGRTFAISTAGSIAGTFATAFFLIPELGTDQLIATLAVVLLLAAAAVALAERLVVASVLAVLLGAASFAAVVSLAPEEQGRVAGSQLQNWSPVYRQRADEDRTTALDFSGEGYDVVYQKDTRYHRVAVVDDEQSRYLRFDNSFQSGMWLDDPYETRFEYSDYLHLGLAYNADARRVLFVGLGGASAPKRMWRDFPRIRFDLVELDPDVVDVAYRFFELERDPRLNVVVEDGRRFLVQDEGPWDVIVMDAFYADSIPFHLATQEFLELARSRLAPGGVVVTNIIGATSGVESRLFRSMLRTYRTVFPTVAIHPVRVEGDENLNGVRNIIVVAGESASPSKEFLLERWRETRRLAPGAPDLSTAIRDRVDRPIRTEDVPVLTDDYAPTDALLLLFG